MRLSNIILRVSDLGESVVFWRDLVGLELSWSGDEFAFFVIGENRLTLNQPLVFEDETSNTEIVFEVEDVHSVVSEMRERGVPFEVEPRAVTTDGERTLFAAHFRDPDGHVASVTGWVEGTD
ncbi:MAG TPA: VOC family protein [Acidimicrobiia bacterium]|nr:VOC family protein [Acidimicrobiia bacterium]